MSLRALSSGAVGRLFCPSSIFTVRATLAPLSSSSSLWSTRSYTSKTEEEQGKAEKDGDKANGKEQNTTETTKKDTEASAKEGDALQEAEKQLAEVKNNYLRCLAEMENLRQRTKKEVQQSKDYAVQKFAKDLLDTVDILSLALKSVDEKARKAADNALLESLFQGVDMTRSELVRTLKRHGVEQIEALDKPFDANFHHAMFETPMPTKKPGTVFVVEKEGYTLKGRVLRPAQVGVVRSD